ncbi:hypothetical protein L596_024117 [Steinernema carpocapsae]|uniref:Uncharacterized protein n=1 Tax=Steinernema carpocapsae TaxID=34508 RepID=A0A4V5ZZN5_STECR|nr:hypothetical protein L596_024117 [Steinernema carpocapsae]
MPRKPKNGRESQSATILELNYKRGEFAESWRHAIRDHGLKGFLWLAFNTRHAILNVNIPLVDLILNDLI